MKTLRALRRLGRDDSGNVATLTAFALFPLIVLLAGVVNFGVAWTMRNDLQAAADAAALAGVSQLGNDANVVSKANEFAANNMPPDVNGDILADADIEIGHWNSATRVFTAGGTPKDAVRTTTRRTEANGNPVPSFLGGFIGLDSWDLGVSAIAALRTEGEGCLLALDPTASGAFSMGGNATLTLNGCGAMSNSTNANSFSITGSAGASMTCALAAGGINVQKLNGLTLTDCASTEPNVPPVPDPFAGVPKPTVPTPCNTQLPSGQAAANINPGCYKGGSLKGSKTFKPGLYIINGGTLQISAQANVTGSGVTFFLTNNATVDFNANGTMTLSAPTSGTYKGVLFFGDNTNTNNTNKFNGTPTSSLTGALYFPNQAVQYLGNFTGVNGCMRIVARTIDFRGTTNMNVTCPNLPPIPFQTRLALVN